MSKVIKQKIGREDIMPNVEHNTPGLKDRVLLLVKASFSKCGQAVLIHVIPLREQGKAKTYSYSRFEFTASVLSKLIQHLLKPCVMTQ